MFFVLFCYNAQMRRVALTACCCIKNRCVAFIERKSQPTPTTTPRSAKKDDIVKEIIAELGKIDKNFITGSRNADPQSTNVSCDYMMIVQSAVSC